MASLSRPSLLLLDEHTAALDPRTADLVMEMTLRIVAEQSLTTLMVTHNMRQAIETGNRLVMMDAGRVRDDIGGTEKAALTPADLVEKFRIDNDRMLLGT
jgi:putative ABC transport system ATP-binding protein